MRNLLLVSIAGLLFATSSGPAAATDQRGAAGASAQTSQADRKAPTRTAADVITVLGCVQRESEYRAQIADGKGGAAGTGAGAGNEFVLRSLRTVSSDTLKPTATSGIRPDEVYSVTGNLEHEMARAVGRQVAVSGYVEVAPSQGTQKVTDLPRLNAVGWHIVSESCPGSTTH
jgi:hypothetical protein